MAEFYLQTQSFLQGEWKAKIEILQEKSQVCVEKCEGNQECQNLCRKGLKDLEKLAEDKESIYVRKGVEYCKSECWEAKDLSKCSERCVSEYTVLLKEFRQVLLDRYSRTRVYNSE